MKKIIYIIALTCVNQIYAQIETNETVNAGVIANSYAFLDATQSVGFSAYNSLGKGIIFPRTDLTLVEVGAADPNNELYDLEGGGLTFAKTYYDGLIVFNVGTGSIPATGMGTSAEPVAPGFYYYRNTGAAWNTGVWMPLGGGGSSTKSKTVTATADGLSATLPLATLDDSDLTTFLGAKIYDGTGKLVMTADSEYNTTTNLLNTGNGLMYQVLPAATYTVIVDYK